MIVSHKHKFIYFDPPKTGTETLNAVFMKYCGGVIVEEETKIDGCLSHNRFAPPNTETYLKIISVRHPIERVLSYYNWTVTLGGASMWRDIDLFVDVYLLRSLSIPAEVQSSLQSRRFPCWKYIEPFGYDHVIHLETIESDLKQLDFIPNNTIIPHLKSLPHAPWSAIKTPELEEKIRLWAGRDFEQFSYE